jgi:hypothetical protein
MKTNAPHSVVAAKPEILENYRDFEPPAQVRRIVEDLLEYLPANYLRELHKIILINQSALTRDQRRQKIWGRRHKYRLAEAKGAYYQATNSSLATVWLFVDNILKSQPPWVLKTPLLCYSEFGEVLYHEIGHHIHAVHKPVHEGQEDVAEDWSKKLWWEFFRRKYWYLIPIRYPLLLLTKLAMRILQSVQDARRTKTASSD